MLALSISSLVLCALYPLAPALGLIDHPRSRRKIHRTPVPTIGGIAIFAGLLAAVLIRFPLDTAFLFGLLGGALLVATGAIDDRFDLGHRTRFAAQIGAALILVVGGGFELSSLGNLLGVGVIDLGPFATPFTVFAIVGIINAFNMIDGIDGLSSGLSLVAMIAILAVLPGGAGSMQLLLLAAIAATVPFLFCNLQVAFCAKRRVFLGDAGSMLLGYIVVWALIDASQTHQAISPAAALWLAAVPLMDTLSVMGRRIMRGQSPFAADRGHIHHVLSRIFASTRVALVLLLLLALTLAGIGLAGQWFGLHEAVIFYGGLVVFVGLLLFQRKAHRVYLLMRRRRRQQQPALDAA
ncbi:MAG: undecaprenyl-phosphate alpha-N-acetylglucosaminyl 1-phosphate transferase [Chromatiaceae bacterium]|nr:undecaprenyl-phosphate alpha-N-acetylglucosaminyl 1-phosphate transferase [Chromatiaceae bacterium]